MSVGVSVRHNFETAHRLPQLGRLSKCFNVHGHTWWAEITVVSEAVDERGLVVEFGEFKRGVREWVDHYLDHGAVLGRDDPLLPLLRNEGCKVYQLETWPTVEALSGELFTVASRILAGCQRAPDARVLRVVLQEGPVNTAMTGSW